ncbi:hypothetical protein EDB86DRAFT_2892659, partial [Lactarius hatsudake]
MRTIFFSSCCVCSSAARCLSMAEMSVSVRPKRAFNAVRLASIAERRELVSTAGGAAKEGLACILYNGRNVTLPLESRPRRRFSPTATVPAKGTVESKTHKDM